MASTPYSPEFAEAYDVIYADEFDPARLDIMVTRLLELANGGRALEFGIGTGRVALALARRGVEVHGIELSQHMADCLRSKPGGDGVRVTIGDMTTARAEGAFALVYVVANTITFPATQAEQAAVFRNAAAHLRPGGVLVIEVTMPPIRHLPPGDRPRTMERLGRNHVRVASFDDLVNQVVTTHNWVEVGGRKVEHTAQHRFVWPAELDLMASNAGMTLRERWSAWDRSPFTPTSHVLIAVYEAAPG